VAPGHSLELRFRQASISGVSAEDLRSQRQRGQKIVLQRDAARENMAPRRSSYGASARIAGKEIRVVGNRDFCAMRLSQ
jgi:hypothetical protein